MKTNVWAKELIETNQQMHKGYTAFSTGCQQSKEINSDNAKKRLYI